MCGNTYSCRDVLRKFGRARVIRGGEVRNLLTDVFGCLQDCRDVSGRRVRQTVDQYKNISSDAYFTRESLQKCSFAMLLIGGVSTSISDDTSFDRYALFGGNR